MEKCPAKLKECDTSKCVNVMEDLKGPFGGCGLGNVPDEIVKKIRAIEECRIDRVCGC